MIYEPFIQNYNRIDFLYEHLMQETSQFTLLSEGFNIYKLIDGAIMIFRRFLRFLNEILFRIKRFFGKGELKKKEEVDFKDKEDYYREFDRPVTLTYVFPEYSGSYIAAQYPIDVIDSRVIYNIIEKGNEFDEEYYSEYIEDDKKAIEENMNGTFYNSMTFFEKEVTITKYSQINSVLGEIESRLRCTKLCINNSGKRMQESLQEAKTVTENSLKLIEELRQKEGEIEQDKVRKLIQLLMIQNQINQEQTSNITETLNFIMNIKTICDSYEEDIETIRTTEVNHVFSKGLIIKDFGRMTKKYTNALNNAYNTYKSKIEGIDLKDDIWVHKVEKILF